MAQQQQSEQVVTPVGRIVMGDLYNPRTQDQEGRPLVYKSGAKAGQPRKDFFFAVAIPKGPEIAQPHAHLNWIHTTWGQAIYKAGVSFLAHAASLPSFAWKVQDGDSTVPNKAGSILSQREGCKGCWVVVFNGTIQPRLCNADGSQQLMEPNAIRPGYFVQVCFTAVGNGAAQQPGVYLNPLAVALAGFGEVISYGVNTAAVGFGGVALPAGASTTPLAGLPAAGVALPPGMPGTAPVAMVPPPLPATPMPSAIPVPVAAPVSLPPTAGAVSLGVAAPQVALPNVPPNPAFLQPAAAMPALPPMPAAGVRLTPAAGAYTLEQLHGLGYTDDALVAAGWAVR